MGFKKIKRKGKTMKVYERDMVNVEQWHMSERMPYIGFPVYEGDYVTVDIKDDEKVLVTLSRERKVK